jgi:hypothetical protein
MNAAVATSHSIGRNDGLVGTITLSMVGAIRSSGIGAIVLGVGAIEMLVGANATFVGATKILVGAILSLVGAIKILVGATGMVVGARLTTGCEVNHRVRG